MSNLILKLRCKEHKKNKIIGKCDNSSCSKDPLFCIDCLACDHHQNHLEDTTNFGDLELILKELILQWSIKNRITNSLNSKSEISEVQLDEEINQQNVISNPIQCIESNDLQLKLQKDQLLELQNQEKIIQEKRECGQCHQFQELSQYVNGEKGGVCNNCLDQKCSTCQQYFNDPLEKIENENYCKECLKCHECNRFKPKKLVGSFFFHEDSLKISQNSALKKEMIAYIQKYFATRQQKADNNEKTIFFQAQPYPCLDLQDYSGYIIGYNHPIIKNKIEIDVKAITITQEQADKYLIEDLDQFERELYQFYLRKGRKSDDIPENIRMLQLFILFIFKDFNLVLNLVNQSTYNHHFTEISKYQYLKTQQILKGRVEKALDFFNDRFHKTDGSIRDKTLINQIRKVLPTYKRN
ncbi:unnamed protein product [Paramecium octaurelia]|uniref:Uncharacterized protein n=1 Tax=Paramecium octaurelia TaxID=43137 RepID=A0A8S1W607_PAROT|nr:unnamed protein product [Paramecium octaurelia]